MPRWPAKGQEGAAKGRSEPSSYHPSLTLLGRLVGPLIGSGLLLLANHRGSLLRRNVKIEVATQKLQNFARGLHPASLAANPPIAPPAKGPRWLGHKALVEGLLSLHAGLTHAWAHLVPLEALAWPDGYPVARPVRGLLIAPSKAVEGCSVGGSGGALSLLLVGIL